MLDFITIDPLLESATRHWRLTGHNRTNTDDGRLFARLSDQSGQTLIELFRRFERQPADLVAQGLGATGTITLNAANGSGLSGSVELIAGATGDASLVVFYATDADLDAFEGNLPSLLNGGQFAGESGFERFTALAKRSLDDAIVARLRREGIHGRTRDELLSALINLSELAEPAAYLTLALIFERLAGAPDEKALQRSHYFQRRYEHALSHARLMFDFSFTGYSSLTLLFGDMALVRG